MNNIVIGLASNVPEGEQKLMEAAEWLTQTFSSCRCSEIYLTDAARGATGKYFNAVAIAATDLPCSEVNALLKNYEKSHGRTPEMKSLHIVPIDLDLVMYGGTVLRPADMACEYFMKGYRMLVLNK